ncbi:hypothetical protein E2C01_040010 [Portunus trituberculatus]|uniref:Uncharacterized protein n=1 Tax=Portunus trituberculatus TaxID=210409 RepID=A0A5B7FLJ6_PORTR|nr:hypothetical protein [Portunus trituberculatus]
MLGTGEGRGGNTHYTGLRLNTWWADKTQWECGSKASPGNHLLHPTQLRVAMVNQGEVEMEAAKKRAPKKAGRSKKRCQAQKGSEIWLASWAGGSWHACVQR